MPAKRPASRARVAFVKAEANGNDFLVVAADAVPPAGREAFTRAICDRHAGIGADGVEFVAPRRGQAALGLAPIEWELTLHNADGGWAELSGNGTRCVAAWLAFSGWRGGKLRTSVGLHDVAVLSGQACSWSIAIALGTPVLLPPARLRIVGKMRTLTLLSMGNPHCVHRVEEFPSNTESIGAVLEAHPHFPHRTNVELMRVRSRHTLEIRIFERGVGPTQSSGTGSCAAAIAAIANHWCDSPVSVITPGGVQEVAWAGPGEPAHLTGPARVLARGQFHPPEAAAAR